jgi:hypothetical protein
MSTLETLLETEDARLEPVARLYSWSTKYESGKGPFTAFLDLIGWSMDELGETLFNFKDASLGYLELGYLASALDTYSEHPSDVMDYVNALMSAEEAEL